MRAKDAGLTWPLPADLTDDFLEKTLFAKEGRKARHRRHPLRALGGISAGSPGGLRLLPLCCGPAYVISPGGPGGQ